MTCWFWISVEKRDANQDLGFLDVTLFEAPRNVVMGRILGEWRCRKLPDTMIYAHRSGVLFGTVEGCKEKGNEVRTPWSRRLRQWRGWRFRIPFFGAVSIPSRLKVRRKRPCVKFLLRRERVGAKAIGYRRATSEIRLLQGHHSQ
jgi:hypothetical protein